LIVAIAMLVAVIFIDPYRYDRFGQYPVRINRITGEAERLTVSGWIEMNPADAQPAPARWVP
jgi:hypothetical protein